MARQIAVGIDIGTHEVKVVVAEELHDGSNLGPKIIGTGVAESRGLHHGFITNIDEASHSIASAVAQAEKTAGIKVKRAFVSIGGIGLSGITTNGSTIISRADFEVSPLDLNKALESAEGAIPKGVSVNKKIINTIPIEYKIDGKVVWGQALGQKAEKLDVKTFFIMCLDHHIQNLIKAVEEVNIEVIDVVAAPIASSFVNLSKREKKAGCVLANIGAETVSMIVFENGDPISLEVFPIGGTDITNDIALGLKISLEEAESIKLGSITHTTYSKKKLDEIISARLEDIFELIETHLKKIQRNALLPAGIIITGGGSKLPMLKVMAEDNLKLPSRMADIHFGSESGAGSIKQKDLTWSVAYGLAILGFNAENEQRSIGLGNVEKMAESGKKGLRNMGNWFSQFLP
jgi:cell division protein FtsA